MSSNGNSLIGAYLDRIRNFYDSAPTESSLFGRHYRALLGHYYRFLIPPNASILEIGCGSGELLEQLPNRDVTGVDLSSTQIERARKRIPHGTFHVGAAEFLERTAGINRTFDYIILSDTVNYAADVQMILEKLKAFAHERSRLILNFYNTVWYPIMKIGTALGIKAREPVSNWFSTSDVQNLLALSSWEAIHHEHRVLLPAPILGLEKLVNRFIAPFLPFFCLTIFQTARVCMDSRLPPQKVSVVVPARNEAGNIEAVVERVPDIGAGTEIVFVEGHSKDDTYERIQRVAADHPERSIKILRQSGKGKGNAVREAFEVATGDILMILDADLTMPPEELGKFYEALVSRRTEAVNGVRLVYPMEAKAMRFLNMCANKFFSIAFSWIIGQSIKDTLCGTKVLFRRDYQSIAANRSFFGDFDPFGDFDLLFGAAKLNLKIIDIPVRYQERTYGETNIRRWTHGWLLLKMLVFALFKIKFV